MTSSLVTVTADPDAPYLMDFDEVYINRGNTHSPCYCYQNIQHCTTDDILIYMHDDVSIHDPTWRERLVEVFSDKDVVAAGFGGATGLGNSDLYRKPYNIWNMARSGYASNQTDAEVHGERFTGSRRVAVLDAFCMAVHVDWLRSLGGWPVDHLTHHVLDLWLACEAARHDKKVYMVGVDCTHHGGGTSTKPAYSQARWLQGGTLESDHQIPHRWLFNEYRDVLPISVKETM